MEARRSLEQSYVNFLSDASLSYGDRVTLLGAVRGRNDSWHAMAFASPPLLIQISLTGKGEQGDSLIVMRRHTRRPRTFSYDAVPVELLHQLMRDIENDIVRVLAEAH